MTAARFEVPRKWPARPLTVAEYLELGETELPIELVEGLLSMAPRPRPKHIEASYVLTTALRAALPTGLRVLQEADVDLELAPVDQPGFVRIPDLVVAKAEAVRRVDEHGGLLRASNTVLVVEIISPGSVRRDRSVKREEYADAGIPYYWIVDLEPPVSLLACHQAGEFGFADDGEFTGTFRTGRPFPFELDLDTLV